MAKKFSFQIEIPVPGGNVLIGNLDIRAISDINEDIIYEHIYWKEVDMLSLFDNLTEAEEIMQMITSACLDFIENLTMFDRWQLEEFGNIIETDADDYTLRQIEFQNWMISNSIPQPLID